MDPDSLKRAANKKIGQDKSSSLSHAEKSGSEGWPSKWKEIERLIKAPSEKEEPQSKWSKGISSSSNDSGLAIPDMEGLKIENKKSYDMPTKNESEWESEMNSLVQWLKGYNGNMLDELSSFLSLEGKSLNIELINSVFIFRPLIK